MKKDNSKRALKGQTNDRTPRVERRSLTELLAFPLQEDYYDRLSQADLEGLAADIARNGLRQMIEILPDNEAGFPRDTILCGHQRQQALLMNHVEACEVVVRYDLSHADANEIERVFHGSNLTRRHLTPLAKARAVLRIFEIEQGRSRGELNRFDHEEARDRVGVAIGMSGRNLQRYFNLLRAPIQVQQAFEDRQLPLVDASRVGHLDEKAKTQIAKRIERGEDPRTVIASFQAPKTDRHVSAGNALAGFVRSLRRGLADLEGRLDRFDRRMLADYVDTFQQAKRVLSLLIRTSGRDHPEPS